MFQLSGLIAGYYEVYPEIMSSINEGTSHIRLDYRLSILVYLPLMVTANKTATGWKIAYWVLLVCWIVGAALNMARVHGGFLTDYLADLTFPPFFYIMLRGKITDRPMVIRAFHWFGRTPLRAASSIFLVGTAAEVNSYFRPHGPFGGTYDPWDIAAYVLGLGFCYLIERREAE